MDDDIIESNIELYVNEFSLSLGDKGKNAINKLKEMAQCKKVLQSV
jgi:predicted solute-binding protein